MPARRSPLTLLSATVALALLCSLVTGPGSAWAQGPAVRHAAVEADPATGDPIHAFVHRSLPASPNGTRVEVVVGQLDPRLRLAPCRRIEPYLLAGTRLWGRTSIGVRCLEGAQWSVTLPITVSVFGPALVAAEALPAGSPAALAPVRLEQAELTRESGTPLTDPGQLLGRSLIRPIAAGQILRLEHLKIQPNVTAGDPVRIEMVGRGFVVQAEGQALMAGAEGQSIRARTESGRIVAGTLRGRTVEIRI